MKFLTAPLGLLLLAGLCLSDDFGYGEENGPEHWGEMFKTCRGNRQSPINIDKKTAKSVNLPPLELWTSDILCEVTMSNNGHSIQLKPDKSNLIVKGGPLKQDSYAFEQLHFHWGRNDKEGSETLINNRSYPLEMHAVFYNMKYKSMNEAVKHEDGLTVLGYMFMISRNRFGANPIMKPIAKALKDVTDAGTNTTLRESDLLYKLLAPILSTQSYFMYNGSLTTPPCSEIVTWIVFEKEQDLTSKQLESFRNVKSSDGTKMTHNFRPPQPLDGREVFQNIPNEQNSGQCGNKVSSYYMGTLGPLLGLGLSLV